MENSVSSSIVQYGLSGIPCYYVSVSSAKCADIVNSQLKMHHVYCSVFSVVYSFTGWKRKWMIAVCNIYWTIKSSKMTGKTFLGTFFMHIAIGIICRIKIH